MRITENFTNPLNRAEPQRVSVELVARDGERYVALDVDYSLPRFLVGELDTLIAMLEAVKLRASKE